MTRLKSYLQAHQRSLLLLLVILLALPVLRLQEGFIRGDVFSYMVLGQNVLEGEGYITLPDSYLIEGSVRGPVYPLLFSALFALFGVSTTTALLVSKLVFLLSVITAFFLASALYERRTGLLWAVLLVSSAYLVGLNAHLEIDPVMVWFMLLSLYLAVLSLKRASLGLGLLSGVSLALGFLTKEIALLWLPLPAYLLISVPQWRQWRSARSMAGYALGFAGTAGAWWLYYYLETGQIFMAARASLMSFVLAMLPWLLVFSVLAAVAIYGAYRLHGRLRQSERGRRVLAIAVQGAGWGLWLVCTALLTIVLAQQSAWFYSVTEIPLRLVGFKDWWDLRVIPYHPLFTYWILVPALLILLARLVLRRSTGDKVLAWSALSLVPQVLTLSMPGQYVQVERYGIAFFWLGYLLLASVGAWLLERLDRALVRGEQPPLFRLSSVALAGLAVWGFWSAWTIADEHAYWDIRPRFAFNNEAVHEVSDWLRTNVPPGSVIGSSAQYADSWDFYSGGAYQVERWYSFNKKDLSDRLWPMVPYTRLVLTSGRLELQDVRSDRPLPAISYIQHAKTRSVQQGDVPEAISRGYTSISRQALIDVLEDLGIEYLIVSSTSSADRYMLTALPDFFSDHPAFQKRFSTEWWEGTDQYVITVYQLDRARLDDFDYPVIVTANTWPILIEDAVSLLGAEFELYDLLQALSSGPIVFRPESPSNVDEYQRIAEAYLAHGQVDLAAFEYHLALQEAPDYAAVLHQVAVGLTEDARASSGGWLLLGDVHLAQGQAEQAVAAYRQALTLPAADKIVTSALHQGLGRAYLALGQYALASEHMVLGASDHLFQAAASRLPQLVAQANILLTQGDLAGASALISAYTAAAGHGARSDHDPAVAVDLVSRLSELDTGTSPGEMTGLRMFVIEDWPHLVLFAHPPAELRYTVDLPAGTYLEVAPVLAPEVWQVGKGDGVQFEIYVEDGATRTRVYDRYVDPKNVASQRAWDQDRVDLSAWSDRPVTLCFVTSSGPNDDERFDWAAWGEPRLVQPVAYDLIERLEEARIENRELGRTWVMTQTIDSQVRPILAQQPTSRVIYQLTLPPRSSLRFGVGVNPAVWSSGVCDGVQYNVYVRAPSLSGTLLNVWDRWLAPCHHAEDRHWFDAQIDLDRFGGQTVEIILEALPDPAGQANGVWGGWSRPLVIDKSTPGDTASGRLGGPESGP